MVALFLLLIAILYASIGHGGASGYLSVLLLAGYSPDVLRPLVLSMNIVVTLYLLLSTNYAKLLGNTLFTKLIVSSIPLAMIGGITQIDAIIYQALLGVMLAFSAYKLLQSQAGFIETAEPKSFHVYCVGAVLGFLSGLTGIGGGVFLSPILIFMRWVSIKRSIPIVAAFILVNSIGGLIGWSVGGNDFLLIGYKQFAMFLIMAFFGAVAGAYFSRNVASNQLLKILLSIVLLIASLKMIYLSGTAWL